MKRLKTCHLFYQAEGHMERDGVSFPKHSDKFRVDNQRVLGDIIFVSRNGLIWHDTTRESGPHKTSTTAGSIGVIKAFPC